MLKQRIITSFFLFALFVVTVCYLPTLYYSIFTGAIWLVAAWEWSNFISYKKKTYRVFYLFLLMGLGVASLVLLSESIVLQTGQVVFLTKILFWVIAFFCCAWLIIFYWILTYPKTAFMWSHKFVISFLGIMLLIPSWLAVAYLKSFNMYSLFALIFIVGFADIGAYFVGRAWGQKKLAPKVSPGKSWNGFYGGMIAATGITVVIGYILLDLSSIMDWLMLICVGVATALAAAFGDLIESMVKRQRGIKDSGHLLPGHGGVFDRIDGLIVGAQIYALLLLLFGFNFVPLL